MRIVYLTFVLILFKSIVNAQECDINLKGRVLDESTKQALPFSTIYLEEQDRSTLSDENGFFELKNICPCTDCHLQISHFGCDPKRLFFPISSDSTLTFKLHHHTELLSEVVVHGEEVQAQISNTIQKSDIKSKGNKNIAEILSSIEGVSTLKNGSGISKPIVHGLFGNRVSIINNEIPQSGQRWGNDHAPEIDLFIADHLSVVKGSSALAYAGSSLGSVVLVEVDPIPNDPHLHGEANYLFETNGRGHTANFQLMNANKFINWKVTGTAKRIGDQKSPDYYLTNTGRKENDIAIQLEKKVNNQWNSSLYYSYVNAEIGILRGASVSTTTDIENTFDYDEPFGTKDNFSRTINPPRQLVNHHLVKFKNSYYFNDTTSLQLIVSSQWNNRKEFDRRRGGRSSIPAVFMKQNQHYGELTYHKTLKRKTQLKTGLQYTQISNINDNETTGRLPLIPQYSSVNPAAFIILQKPANNLLWEFGARYGFLYRKVKDITRTVPRTIQVFNNNFHTVGLNTALNYKWSKKLESNFNIGLAYRPPEVNELYSFGVHQAVASFDRGNPNLKPEKSVKAVISNKLLLSDNIHLQLLSYFQKVNDFIYSQPALDDTSNPSGSFRFFDYRQANVNIYGLDAKLTYEPIEQLKWVTKYAIVRGDNLDDNLSLVNLPADNISSSIEYYFKEGNKFKNTQLSIGGKYVAKQSRISVEDNQDFFPTPKAYFLANASFKSSLQFKSAFLTFNISVENAFDQSYRDYLNRLRYFSDEVGRTLILGINYRF